MGMTYSMSSPPSPLKVGDLEDKSPFIPFIPSIPRDSVETADPEAIQAEPRLPTVGTPARNMPDQAQSIALAGLIAVSNQHSGGHP
jgi:hypothetical protein